MGTSERHVRIFSHSGIYSTVMEKAMPLSCASAVNVLRGGTGGLVSKLEDIFRLVRSGQMTAQLRKLAMA